MATAQGQKAGTGWIAFSGVMLIIVGLLDVVDGLWALDRADTKINGLLYADKLGGWGWFYLILGIILVLAGIGVFYRSQVGAMDRQSSWRRSRSCRTCCGCSCSQVTSLVVMFLATLVVYGLVVYGEPRHGLTHTTSGC